MVATQRYPMDFTYCILLTGNDYPIQPLSLIRRRLGTTGKQIIRIDGSLVLNRDDLLDDGSHDHIAYYYFLDNPFFNPRSGLPIWFGTWFSTQLKRIHRLSTVRMMGPRPYPYLSILIPYKGNGWWTLTSDCVSYILAFIDEHPEIVRFYQHVFAPEEILFPSIVKQSPFTDDIMMDCSRSPCLDWMTNASHFIDWRPENYHRKLWLDLSYWDELLMSDCFFARKFDEHLSFDLLKRIDKHILSEQLETIQ